jgi:DNA-binding transcriptional ArsR family regulator
MQVPELEIFDLQAKLCATMANPTRLRIIEVLKGGETSVGAVAEALGLSISTASKQLRLMRDNKVVTARKDAQTVYYRVRHRKIIECCQLVREVLVEDLQDQGRLARDYAENGQATWGGS